VATEPRKVAAIGQASAQRRGTVRRHRGTAWPQGVRKCLRHNGGSWRPQPSRIRTGWWLG
jgi:hypothetical protein